MTRWIIVIVIVVAAIGAAVYYESMQGIPVQVSPAVKGDISAIVDERAETRLPVLYTLRMPITGRIDPVTIEVGTKVKKGEVVAQMTSKDLDIPVSEAESKEKMVQAEIIVNDNMSLEDTANEEVDKILIAFDSSIDSIKSDLKAREAEKTYALKEFDNQSKLFKDQATTEDAYDLARTQKDEAVANYNSTQLRLQASQGFRVAVAMGKNAVSAFKKIKTLKSDVLRSQLDMAKLDVEAKQLVQSRGELKSPVDGIALEKYITNAQVLAVGTPVLEIGSLEELEVESDVLSEDAVTIKVGNTVDIYGQAIGDMPLKGKVKRISPKGFTKVSSLGVEQERVKVVVSFEPNELQKLIEQGRSLGVSYRVRVKIYTAEKKDAIKVPRNALFRSESGGWQIFVVKNGLATLTNVTLGLKNDEEVEILKGVSADDQVILAPESSLASGTRVSPTEISVVGSKSSHSEQHSIKKE